MWFLPRSPKRKGFPTLSFLQAVSGSWQQFRFSSEMAEEQDRKNKVLWVTEATELPYQPRLVKLLHNGTDFSLIRPLCLEVSANTSFPFILTHMYILERPGTLSSCVKSSWHEWYQSALQRQSFARGMNLVTSKDLILHLSQPSTAVSTI